MKTKNKLSAYILRGSTGALLFSCVIVELCSAINLSEQPRKAPSPQDNAAFGANAHQSRSLSFADRVAYQRAIEDVYWRHRTPESAEVRPLFQSPSRGWFLVPRGTGLQLMRVQQSSLNEI